MKSIARFRESVSVTGIQNRNKLPGRGNSVWWDRKGITSKEVRKGHCGGV